MRRLIASTLIEEYISEELDDKRVILLGDLNANFYPVKLNAETPDSIYFMGKTYFNTQKEKVKEILDSIKKDLLIREIKIKQNDSIITTQMNILKPKIRFVKEVMQKTGFILNIMK